MHRGRRACLLPRRRAEAYGRHVKRLRGKLEPAPSRPRHLLTVRGRGYRFEAGLAAAASSNSRGIRRRVLR